MRCGAVVAAAGSSRRMGAGDKTLATVAGRPVLAWTFAAVAAVAQIEQVVVVTSAANRDAATRLVEELLPGRATLCSGGATRQESVARGLARLSPEIDLVAIHDAARPLATPALFAAGIALAAEHGTAVAALPVSDTIKRVGSDGVVVETPDRSALYAAQTPQVFRRDWLEQASVQEGHDATRGVTDEASLLERAGFPVRIYPGSPENIKITTPIDLIVAEALLTRRAGGPVR